MDIQLLTTLCAVFIVGLMALCYFIGVNLTKKKYYNLGYKEGYSDCIDDSKKVFKARK